MRKYLTILTSAAIALMFFCSGCSSGNKKDNTVAVTGVTVSPASVSLTVGGAQQLTPTVSPGDATNKSVSWSSSSTSASVSVSGLVTANAPGSATITVTTADGNRTATCTVTVAAVPISVDRVTLNRNTMTLAKGDATGTLTATIAPLDATNRTITWSSGNSAIASVDASTGVVTPKTVGEARITATAHNGEKAECTVEVVVEPIEAEIIIPNKYNMTLSVGGTEPFIATFIPANATDQNIEWSSSDTSIATIDPITGAVTAIKSGTVTISAKSVNPPLSMKAVKGIRNSSSSGEGEDIFPAPLTVNVTASAIEATAVTLNNNILTLTVGNTETLVPTVQPTNATNQSVNWSSSDTSVALVSSSGVVTALKQGMAAIAVATQNGKVAACVVNVLPAPPAPVHASSVILNKSAMTLTPGGSEALAAIVLPDDAVNRNAYWTSSNNAAAVVSSGGLVTAVATGTATITVHTVDGNKTAACVVTVVSSAVPVTSVTLNKTTTRLFVNGSERLTATVLPTGATNQAISWASSNTAIATVTSNGMVTGHAAGSANITVTTADGGRTATCAVTVESGINVSSIRLNKARTSLMPNETETLVATIEPANATDKTITWSSSNPKAVTVTNGLVTVVGAGTAVITATASGGRTAACEVTVVNLYLAGGYLPTNDWPLYWPLYANPVIYKNNVRYILSMPEKDNDDWDHYDHYGTTSLVAVSDKGDLYASGGEQEYFEWFDADKGAWDYKYWFAPVIWKNGVIQYLNPERPEGYQQEMGDEGIYISGDDVYVAGGALDSNTAYNWYAKLWKNGVAQKLELIEGEGQKNSAAIGVFAYGNNVYVAGWDTTVSPAVRRGIATLWDKDGKAQRLTNPEISSGAARSVCVVGGDVYVAGTESITGQGTLPTVWKNGVPQRLGIPEGSMININYVNSLAVTDSGDVYVAGSTTFVHNGAIRECTTLWKNGVPIVLVKPENGTGANNSISRVAVFGDDVYVLGGETIDGITYYSVWKNGVQKRLDYAAPSRNIFVARAHTETSGVSFNGPAVSIYEGASEKPGVWFVPFNASPAVTWSSSDTTIATVSNDGTLTGVKPGAATITVRTVEGGYTASCEVTVMPVTRVTGITMQLNEVTMAARSSRIVYTILSPYNATYVDVRFTTSDASVVRINSVNLAGGDQLYPYCNVTAMSPGTATITATTVDGGFTATCVITVYNQPVTGIAMNPTSTALEVDETLVLYSTIQPTNASDITVSWSSSNPEVVSLVNPATTSTAAQIRANALGTATITVTTRDGEYKATCEVTVAPAGTVLPLNSNKVNTADVEKTPKTKEQLLNDRLAVREPLRIDEVKNNEVIVMD